MSQKMRVDFHDLPKKRTKKLGKGQAMNLQVLTMLSLPGKMGFHTFFKSFFLPKVFRKLFRSLTNELRL